MSSVQRTFDEIVFGNAYLFDTGCLIARAGFGLVALLLTRASNTFKHDLLTIKHGIRDTSTDFANAQIM